MMRWIVEWSLKFRLLIVAAAASVIAVGVSQLRDMPVDVLPEFGPTTVEVQTESLGLSAAEVEQLITVPMEQDLLNGVAFLDDIRSQSVPGLSRILLVFEPGTDLFTARQVVAERLTQAHALPNVSKPPQMIQPLSSTNRVLMIGASSKDVSPIDMSILARWTIMPRLLGVPGVANVSIWGFRDRQLQVQVDPKRLRRENVSLLQVIETSGNSLWVSPLTFLEASTPGTGGFIDFPNQRLGVYHVSPIHTAADLATVRVEGVQGRNLLLGDVANIVEDHQPLIGDALTNDSPGLLFVVEKFPNASTLDVTRGVESAIDAMKPGMAGIEFDTGIYRPASYIDESIDSLTMALIIAALLVALAIAAFFFRWRTALISIVVIPVSLVAAALVLYALGSTMNAIVLTGLVAALVIVIDDAVIGAENVTRRLDEHRSEEAGTSTAAVIVAATLEMRRPIAYATVIIALGVLPAFFLNGLTGSFFPDVAGAYLIAIVTSMVIALALTPALGMLLLPRARFGRESPLVGLLHRGYGAALARVVRRPLPMYVVAGIVLAAAVIASPFLTSKPLPTLKEQQLLIQWDGPPGTSLPEMDRVTALVSNELRSVDGVRDVGAHVGRAVTSDQSVGANSAELWVSIDPSADYDSTVASVHRLIDGYPGMSRSIETFSNERATEAFARADKDVVVRMYGEELDVLRSQAAKVKQVVASVDGTTDVGVELPVEEPTLEIEVDLKKAQQRGIKPGDVRRAASTLLSGVVVGSLFEQQKVFDVVVWGAPKTRDNLTDIRNLLLDTPEGDHVRLGEVADVRIAPNPTVIQRQGVSRYLDVSANVSGRDRGSVVGDIEDRVAAMQLPLEYHAELLDAGGQPRGRLIALGIAAAIGIFLILQVCFGSWRLATLSFVTLPFAVTGGVLAATADGGKLSFGSLIGLAVVLGLAVRNGVLLFDRFRHLEQSDGEHFGSELVVRGAQDRVVAITLTATATALAMLPLVVAGSRPGYELVHPLAVVVLGGVVTSTLLNLFLAPALYLRFGYVPARERPFEELVSDLGQAPPAPARQPTAVMETEALPEASS